MALGNSDKIGVAYVELKADMTKFNADLLKLKANTEKATHKASSGFNKMTASIGRMVAGLIAAKAAWTFAKEAKNAARDAEETRSKFNTVFESIQNKANETADNLARDFGLAGTTARKLLGDTGDLLVGFGFAEGKALDLSKQVNTLAQDLSSFTNFAGGAEGANQALTKAILGETESVKALGIVLRQNTPEFKKAMEQTMRNQNVDSNQARALVLLKEMYRQSGKAVGDYERTKNSLANVEKRLDEEQKQTMETLGKELVPLFRLVTGLISDLTVETGKSTTSLSLFGTGAKVIGTIIAGVVGGIKVVITAVGGMTAAFVGWFTKGLDFGRKVAARTLKDIEIISLETGKSVKELWTDLTDDTAAKKLTKTTEETTKKVKKEWEGTLHTVFDLKNAIAALDDEIDKTSMTDIEQLKRLALKQGYLEEQLRLIELLREQQKKPSLPESEKDTEESRAKEMEDNVLPMLEDIDTAMIDLNDVTNVLGSSMQSAASRSLSGWARQLELIKGANTFAGKLLNNILQIAAQAVVLKLLGTFATGGAGGAGLFGMISSFLSPGKAQFGGTFTGGSNGALKLAGGGSGIVPSGFPNDTFPMLVSSREEFEVKTPGQARKSDQMFNDLLNSFNGLRKSILNQPRANINIKSELDGLTFTEEVVEPAQEILNKEKSFGS